jgi:type I restriction-modification system DNA methylase subunit/restriction endonuclease S subunit
MANKTQVEWLVFLHQLHNKVRNAKGLKLTGMPALIEISNFIMFRFLDDSKELGINLQEEDKMIHLYKNYATDEKINEDRKVKLIKDKNSYKLWEAIYDVKQNPDCLIFKYYQNKYLNSLLESTTSKVSAYINKPTSADVIQDIINSIYKGFEGVKFDSKFFDMFGSAYEKFKTDANGNAGKNTAQHFTNVFIKQIIVTELKPVHTDIFYEPCAGTGGFIHTADHYVCEQEGDEKAKIFKSNIYANECNPEIYRPLMMNMLFHNIPVINILEQDSLCTENIKKMLNKADIIASNFPFGMSTVLTHEGDFSDWIKYWKVLESGKGHIKNSSAQFMIHMCNSLKPNGRLGVVSDRGILNNGTDKETSAETKVRKHLFENYNLYKIVLLPENSFTYTKFQTCIIFLKKGETTSVCKVYEAHFRKPKEFRTSEMYLDENPLYTYNIADLRKTNYSIKPVLVEVGSAGEYVKLGDIIDHVKYESKMDNHKVENGKYPFYNSTIANHLYCDEYTNDEECIIINKVNGSGKCKLFFNSGKFSATSAVIIFNTNNPNYLNKFIYYYLNIIKSFVESKYGGGDKKSLTNNQFESILFPSIPLSHQKEIVDVLDEQFQQYNIELLSPYTKTIKLFDLLIYKKYEEFKEAMHIIYRKIEANAMHQKFEMDKRAIFNILVNNTEHDVVSLGEVANMERGNIITIAKLCDGEYPVIGGGQTPMGMHNTYNRNENTIVISQSGSYAGFVSMYTTKIYASDCFSVIPIQNNLVNKFLYYYLKYKQNRIYDLQHGSGQPHISANNMTDFKIKRPSIEDQQAIIKQIEQMEITQKTYADYSILLTQQMDKINSMIKNICIIPEKKELDEPLIADTINENGDENKSEISEEIIIKPKAIKKKKIVEDTKNTVIMQPIIKQVKTIRKKKQINNDDKIKSDTS